MRQGAPVLWPARAGKHDHAGAAPPTSPRARNDPGQYDDLVDEWWVPRGAFAMLHWLARARARLVPPPTRPGAVLVDIGCGAGLSAPHFQPLGYRHVGLDVTASALALARAHEVAVVRADALQLPLPDAVAEVVVAGEVLEHVSDWERCTAEACRVLRPGGTLVLDTIASTWLARFMAITVAERVPGGAPPGLHDPALFVDRSALIRCCAEHGVSLHLSGLRPCLLDLARWRLGRRAEVAMLPTRSTAVLFQAWGLKRG